jgi:hypothetical protein
MQKHKFGATSPDVIFVEFVTLPPEHKKLCFDVSCGRQNGMKYMSCSSHQMQKHMFSVTSPDALFVESEPVPPQLEK